MSKFVLKTYHVNSESVLIDVSGFINSILVDFNVNWDNDSQREAILEIIDEHLEDMFNDNKIEQWNIICDRRNNKQNTKTNTINLDIEFTQRNCYNVTRLNYVITR